jgi:hypothetical protein
MKCPCCGIVVRKNWYYCPYCALLLKKKRIAPYDKTICENCGLMRARHIGLMESIGACNKFKRVKK